MGGWTLTKGKTSEHTITSPSSAGARFFALVGANTFYSPGDLLFMSESDGSETEFLGAVVAATVTMLESTLPLLKAKSANAKIWKPTNHFGFSAEFSPPLTRKIGTGVTVTRTGGGGYSASRTTDRTDTMVLVWEGMAPGLDEDLTSWLESATNGGLDPFTLVFPSRKVEAVRLYDDGYSRVVRPGDRCDLRLPLIIEAEGEYR